ncbi:MAG: 4-(cytidine 5'-diphospho)-2-C-methyl-D-erythritol kinase [Bacillota bacterium]|nr:4-(cytidine 5'-diphospho)-2-C-methyl-D-erythritol kinase [Bacillota bacterium]
MTDRVANLGALDSAQVEYRLLTYADVSTLSNWSESSDLRLSHYTFTHFDQEDLLDWYHAKQKFLSKKLFGLVIDGQVIGFVTLRQMNFITRSAMLGVAIDPAHLSLGYGSELLLRHLDYVYRRFPIDTMYLQVATFNHRAIRAYKKVGFFIEGEPRWDAYENQAFKWNLLKEDPEHFRVRDGVLESLFYRMKHSSGTVRRKAHAKINLALDVVRRLPNGYHELEMVMQSLSLADDVILRRRKDAEWTLDTDAELNHPDNLALRAARLMAETYALPSGADIAIIKRIPVAAGLAGGSADAAAVIHGIDELFELGLGLEEKSALGLRLGADVPFCLMGGTAVARGIGELLEPIAIREPMTYVLVTPEVSVSTKEVFDSLDLGKMEDDMRPNVTELAYVLQNSPRDLAQKYMKNILESVTISRLPEIEEIKQTLRNSGAEHALMSGSGPTVWGWFRDREAAKRTYETLKQRYKNCFLCEAGKVEE